MRRDPVAILRLSTAALACLAASANVFGEPSLTADPPPALEMSDADPRLSQIYLDPQGDAVLRRTDDLSDPTPFVPPTILPDILALSLSGWKAEEPAQNPYAGEVVAADEANLLRLDLVVDGLVNPPGPLAFGGAPFEPFRFGDRPLYGFIEIDIDLDSDTGGDLGSNALWRFLGNVGRFGSVARGARAARTARWGWQNDQFFFSQPQIERSGAEFELALCGCFDVEIVEEGGDGDGVFEAGETWLVASRFFRRSSGFILASGAFGGNAPGHYDPWHALRFSHDPGSDQTIVTLVYPLNQQGAAELAGELAQPPNLDVSDHTSVLEAMLDVVETLKYEFVPDPSFTLAAGWAGRDPAQFLDPAQWTATAIVAATYATQRTAIYIYSDVGFGVVPQDLDGDGVVTDADQLEFGAMLADVDGSTHDADGQMNSQVALSGFAANFSVGDFDQNGVVDADDFALIVPSEDPCSSDFNDDGAVGAADLAFLLGQWGSASSPMVDLNGDGVVGSQDLAVLLGQWGVCPTS